MTRHGLSVLAVLALAGCRGAPPDTAASSDDELTASTQVLWNQSTSCALLSTSFVETLLVADDFVVPAGAEWTITDVRLHGALAPLAPTLPFSIRANASGVPGDVIASYDMAPTSSTPECQDPGEPDLGYETYLFTLGAPVTLTAGTYWIVAPVYVPIFGWEIYTPIVGSGPAVSSDSGATWALIQQPFGDQAFSLLGTLKTAATETEDLQTTLSGMGLPQGITRSLQAKLDAALAALDAGKTTPACQLLRDFIKEVNALAGKKQITAAQAQQLIDAANDILALAGC